MKKRILLFIATVIVSLNASAFTFDGIEITGNVQNVMREISARGYVFNEETNCLEGNCQGTPISMSFNLTDVKTSGKIGQMFITVPVEGGAQAIETAYANAQTIFSIVYHKATEGDAYVADTDGTTMTVTKTAQGLKLTYNTPYYKVRK